MFFRLAGDVALVPVIGKRRLLFQLPVLANPIGK